MNYPAAELRGIKMNLLLIHPDAEHRGILLIKKILADKKDEKLTISPDASVYDAVKMMKK